MIRKLCGCLMLAVGCMCFAAGTSSSAMADIEYSTRSCGLQTDNTACAAQNPCTAPSTGTCVVEGEACAGC